MTAPNGTANGHARADTPGTPKRAGLSLGLPTPQRSADDLFSPVAHDGLTNGGGLSNGAAALSNGAGAAPGTAAELQIKTPIPRRDSRARPPPIRIEAGTPAAAPSPVPNPLEFVVSAPDGDGEADGAEEAGDDVGQLPSELPSTPSRRSFVAATGSPLGANRLGLGGLERPTTPDGLARPASPSWGALDTGDTYSPPPRRPVSLHGRPPSWHRNSLEVPSFLNFPLPPSSPDRGGSGVGSGGRRAFEPTPTHGLHARNLSMHFPHPGAPRPPPSPTAAEASVPVVIPDGDKQAFGGPADWQFGQAPPPGASDGLDTPQTKRGKRRGHHHRHSLSHNFFSFLDPTQTAAAATAAEAAVPQSLSPNAPTSPAAPSPSVANPALSPAAPKSVPMPFTTPAPTAGLSPLPPSKRDPQTQALGWFAVIESVLGAALWIEGQSSGWRCLTAMGYLVVFDALGLGVNIWSKLEPAWRSLRRPYGSSRFTALLCFSQTLFLLFAAVYIAKESLEAALLGPGGHSHGGHSHGDAAAAAGSSERSLPFLLLGMASVASLFSGAALGNHRRLVEATGGIFLPAWYTQSIDPTSFLANPYTLSVAGTTALLLVAGLLLPTSSVTNLDSAASLLLTVLTSALAWPPAMVFAKILLQTAPPGASGQMKALRVALRDVAADQRVLGLGTFRCWAVDAGKPVPRAAPGSAPGSRAGSISSPSVSAFMRAAAVDLKDQTLELFMRNNMSGVAAMSELSPAAQVPLVVTLVVHVHPDTPDREVLALSRTAWTQLNGAINGGKLAGEGEVSVHIRRGWEGVNG